MPVSLGLLVPFKIMDHNILLTNQQDQVEIGLQLQQNHLPLEIRLSPNLSIFWQHKEMALSMQEFSPTLTPKDLCLPYEK